MKSRKFPVWVRISIRIAIVGALLYVLGDLLRTVELARVATLISGIGITAVLVLVPVTIVTLFDTLGWAQSLVEDVPRLRIRDLYGIRIATDAILNALPAGVMLAETLRTVLLHRRFGVRMPRAVASIFVTKINIALSQVAFVFAGLVLTFGIAHGTIPGSGALASPSGVAAAIAILTVIGLALLLPYGGALLTRTLDALERLPSRALRAQIARRRASIVEVDAIVGRFARAHRTRMAGALALFFLAWLGTAAESFVILHLLGIPATVRHAIALEAGASLARIAFFFLPAGVGAVEVSIVALLTAFGIPDPVNVSAAFIVLKRAREACWIAVGFLLFGIFRFNPFRTFVPEAEG